jgi:predicted unusual protein kinase regulating ubiquinone biosynthesis (AarF/ABC1/UbiB family)
VKGLPKIKSGFFARQLGLATLVVSNRKAIFNNALEIGERLREGLGAQGEKIALELGQMKGGLMKAGQMLGQYAGPYLPPEAQSFLRTLESQSFYLDWEHIRERIPATTREALDIDPVPMAAASLGQVHRAVDRQTGAVYAVKIQYEGVRQAIDNDLRALKLLLRALKLLPGDIDLAPIFDEIRSMLHQETDYLQEARELAFFGEKASPTYVVPQVVAAHSGPHVLTSTLLEGQSVRDVALTQPERDRLGEEMLRLFFLELFTWGHVQSDAHLGNFLLVDTPTGRRWGLLDFGAVKIPAPDVSKDYQDMLAALILADRPSYFAMLEKMGYPVSQLDGDAFWDYAQLFATPFRGGVYDWGESDIPDQAMRGGIKLLAGVKRLRPPAATIFVDRKVAGVFFILKTLGARFDARRVAEEFIGGG